MSVIVALSGGKASAWCADWALKTYPKNDVILYFNDTKWEHEDLYRFLKDLSSYFNHPITYDSDGRSPEELFYDHNAIANNRMPFCSHELKAMRLQKYYKDGDKIVFGIGANESHRAIRLIEVYKDISKRKNKQCELLFPLIQEKITKEKIDKFLTDSNIEEPYLYKLGFLHNNCSGGCVRAGKKQWKLLYEKLPEVYLERERVEREMREYTGKDIHIFKDETLESFRGRIERGELSAYYSNDSKEKEDNENDMECVGICQHFN